MFDNSMLNQILKFLPRDLVRNCIQNHDSDRYRKKYKTWDHLVSLLTAQLLKVKSLRELVVVMNANQNQFYHLGLNTPQLSRSTISDANHRIGSGVFRDIAGGLLAQNKKYKKQLKFLLTALDSSPIKVSGRGSAWAQAHRSRNLNQGLKLHLQLDADNNQIEYVELTDHNVNDISVGQRLALEAGRIYVFDKGYCDYNWWKAIADKGSAFVTRLKVNAAYRVLESFDIDAAHQGVILKDQLITLTNRQPRERKKNDFAGVPLRLIEVQHPSDKKKRFMIISNRIEANAEEIAGWYKRRWSIELLFKWLKQNLKLTTFLSEDRNAIMSQIYIAIITFLLMQAFHQTKQIGLDRLKDLAAILKAHLFARPDTGIKWRERKKRKRQSSPQIPLELFYAA